MLKVVFSTIMDRNKLITKLQNLTKSGHRPRTTPGLVVSISSDAVSKAVQLISCQILGFNEPAHVFSRSWSAVG